MAGSISRSFIDDLLSRTDVVEVISSCIDVKKKGQNYWACCPFHNEKSPSFSINASKQFYHCFGCGESGDALKFLQEYERLSFVESVEALAKMAGVEVPRTHDPIQEEKHKKKAQLTDLMDDVSDYYYQNLLDHPQKLKAVNYLKNRGLSGQIAKMFQIGFAPDGWQHLMDKFAKKDELMHQLLAAGMVVQKESDNDTGKAARMYDRFRSRIMFPIRNSRGKTIAFGGRVLNDEKPKYLNSPETAIFSKGQELYGLYEIKKFSKNIERIIVVEGYMDVVALFQAGIGYAVATLGTATSVTHVQTLFKQVDEIVFCFDGDAAGFKAAHRAFEQCLNEAKDGRQIKFLFLPDGEDPDSMVRSIGKVAFEEEIKQAKSLSDYMIEHLQSQVDINSEAGRAKLVELAKPYMISLPDGVFKQLLGKRFSTLVGLELQFGAFEPTVQKVYEPAKEKRVEKRTEKRSDKRVDKKVENKNETLINNIANEYPQDLQEIHSQYDDDDSFLAPNDYYEEPADDNWVDSLPAAHSNKRIHITLSQTDKIVALLIRAPFLSTDYLFDSRLLIKSEFILVCQVMEVLKQLPKSDYFQAYQFLKEKNINGRIADIVHSEYFWLPRKSDNFKELILDELENILSALIDGLPDEAFEQLKRRVLARDPSLSEEEKQQYHQMLLQKK
ncbi:MAG: DNA primase [Saccharospirillaceae bacterium]|nr:DNA primase [Pseudomonadales bacterium]NRB79519.1 DNA primase [Saccharospirillaceae bacterium]